MNVRPQPVGTERLRELESRLAALRAPGEARDGTLYDRLEISVAMRDAGIGGKTILDGVRELIAALSTARRERDEAVGLAQAFVEWGRGRGSSLSMTQEKADELDDLIRRAIVKGAPRELHPEVARLQVVVGTLTNEREALRAQLAEREARVAADPARGLIERCHRMLGYVASTDDKVLRLRDDLRADLRAYLGAP